MRHLLRANLMSANLMSASLMSASLMCASQPITGRRLLEAGGKGR